MKRLDTDKKEQEYNYWKTSVEHRYNIYKQLDRSSYEIGVFCEELSVYVENEDCYARTACR